MVIREQEGSVNAFQCRHNVIAIAQVKGVYTCFQHTERRGCYVNRWAGCQIHVISKEPFDEAAKRNPNDALAIRALYRLVCEIDFSSPTEMKALIPSLDNFKYRNKWWVLDVGGNNLRVIAYIDFVNKRFM